MPDDSSAASTERQRRTERLGYVAPCRCAVTHESTGHQHECIAGEGHSGWHRCYCGAWFEHPDRGSTAPHPIGTQIDLRAARLKPEFASLYPKIQAGAWYVAAAVVSAIWYDRVWGQGRRLSDEHFEFYGGEQRPAVAHTRSGDAPSHGEKRPAMGGSDSPGPQQGV
jgi:hypothetical protein